jgi:hypothetical protein
LDIAPTPVLYAAYACKMGDGLAAAESMGRTAGRFARLGENSKLRWH